VAQYIYLETAPRSGVFHCRGEVGAGSNPEGFAAMMAKSDLRVIGTDGSEFEWERDGNGRIVEDEHGGPVRKALMDVTVEAGGLTLKALGPFSDINALGLRVNVLQRMMLIEQ
jgi:hypothetical protein